MSEPEKKANGASVGAPVFRMRGKHTEFFWGVTAFLLALLTWYSYRDAIIRNLTVENVIVEIKYDKGEYLLQSPENGKLKVALRVKCGDAASLDECRDPGSYTLSVNLKELMDNRRNGKVRLRDEDLDKQYPDGVEAVFLVEEPPIEIVFDEKKGPRVPVQLLYKEDSPMFFEKDGCSYAAYFEFTEPDGAVPYVRISGAASSVQSLVKAELDYPEGKDLVDGETIPLSIRKDVSTWDIVPETVNVKVHVKNIEVGENMSFNIRVIRDRQETTPMVELEANTVSIRVMKTTEQERKLNGNWRLDCIAYVKVEDTVNVGDMLPIRIGGVPREVQYEVLPLGVQNGVEPSPDEEKNGDVRVKVVKVIPVDKKAGETENLDKIGEKTEK